MQLLLTNDDGIDAAGLKALAVAAREFGRCITIGPATNWSVCAHRVTTDAPIRVMLDGESRWRVEGTPADCVRLGLAQLAPETAWVLAGINHGGNLGADVYHSGTVAAVREAVLHGRPGIAFSHYRKRGMEFDWHRAAQWARRALQDLLDTPCEPGTFWNVNFPNLQPHEPEPRLVHCPLDRGPLPLRFCETDDGYHYSGDYHGRARQPGGDVEVCFGGDISVSLLRL
jgi:5'-nucleotidase